MTARAPHSCPPPRGRAVRGFSLIEVVVAVALFAMAATVLTSSFVNALLARERAATNDRYEADLTIARRQLLLEPNREDAIDGGFVPTLHNGEARWSAEIRPANVVDLFRAALTVEFDEPMEGRPATHQESLLLLRPTWSQSDERDELLEDKTEELRDRRDFRRF